MKSPSDRKSFLKNLEKNFSSYRTRSKNQRNYNIPFRLRVLAHEALEQGIAIEEIHKLTGLRIKTLENWKKSCTPATQETKAKAELKQLEIIEPSFADDRLNFIWPSGLCMQVPIHLLSKELLEKLRAVS